MVQSINTKAIFTLASVLRRPALIVPHVSVANISELNYSALKNYVDVVIFDKDNTLTGPYENVIHPNAREGLASALRTFGEDRVAILSNSAGTKDDPDYEDAKMIEEALGIQVIRHDEKKPGGLAEVLQHFSMEDPSKICMVGDRLLTDVVFGNLYGMLTVHTMPLCEGKDNAKDNTVSALVRTAENKLLYNKDKSKKSKLQQKRLPHPHWPGEEEVPLTTVVVDAETNNDAS